MRTGRSFNENALRRVRTTLQRLIVEASEQTESDKQVVWGNTVQQLEEEEQGVKNSWKDYDDVAEVDSATGEPLRDPNGDIIFNEDRVREIVNELVEDSFRVESENLSALDNSYHVFVVADLVARGKKNSRRCEVMHSMEEVFRFARETDYALIYVKDNQLLIERQDHDGTGTYVVYGITEGDYLDVEQRAYVSGREGDNSFEYAGLEDLVYCALTENEPKAKIFFEKVAKPLGHDVKAIYGW